MTPAKFGLVTGLTGTDPTEAKEPSMTTSETRQPPEVLTIEEAAAILRISRNAAYALARQWRTTGGRTGLPCLELGRTLRVPRVALHQLLDDVTPSRGRAADDRIA